MIITPSHCSKSFLCDVRVTPSEAGVSTRPPQIELSDHHVCFEIPTFYAGEVTSIVTLVGDRSPEKIGVFEIWTPTGPYSDLKLSAGYYGKLDRFQNVSTYVRFEPGSGLPGQAWTQGQAIIHDEVRNHPSFLRASGASADDLEMAVGIPLFANSFVATVVLISSRTTPIAKRIEVWIPTGDQQMRLASATSSINRNSTVGDACSASEGIFGLVNQQHASVLSSATSMFSLNRSIDRPALVESGLAIPTYHGTTLRSITLLLF